MNTHTHARVGEERERESTTEIYTAATRKNIHRERDTRESRELLRSPETQICRDTHRGYLGTQRHMQTHIETHEETYGHNLSPAV